MNQERNNDLYKFFKSRLEDTTPSDNGWNVPPMSVLDDALEQLPLPPKRNKLVIPFIILGIAAIGLTGLMVANTLKISNLNEKIETLSEENKQTKEIGSNLSQKEVALSNVDAEQGVVNILASEKNVEQVNISTASSKKTIQTIEQVSQSIASSNSIEINTESVIQEASKAFVDNKILNNVTQDFTSTVSQRDIPKSAFVPVTRRQDLAISKLPLLGLVEKFDSGKTGITLNLNSNLATLIPTSSLEKNIDKKIALTFTAGHLGTDVRMTNINPNSFSLTKYDSFYPGVGFKFGIVANLNNRLKFTSSIGFNNLNNKSQYSSDFIYYENNTVPTSSGDLMHLSSSFVETPMARFSDELALTLREEGISNGEILDQVTSITDTYQIAQLSTGLSAELLRYKKFSLQSGIGLSGNYIINFNQTLDTKMLSNTDVMMDKVIDTNLVPGINRFFLSGNITLGLQYDLTKSTFVQFNSRYEKGLTSIRRQTSNELPKSYLNSFASEITLGYSF